MSEELKKNKNFNKLNFNNFNLVFYWVIRKIRAAKDLNLINEIKNLNLLRFNFPSKSARTFRTIQYIKNSISNCLGTCILIKTDNLYFH